MGRGEGEEADRGRRTEFDEKHAVALLLIRGENDDAGEVVVVIRHFLLWVGSQEAGRQRVAWKNSGRVDYHLREEAKNMISLRVCVCEDIEEDCAKGRIPAADQSVSSSA